MPSSDRLIGLLLACVLALGSAFPALAQGSEEASPEATTATPIARPGASDLPQIGSTVTIADEDGREVVAITVQNVTDPYDDFHERFQGDEDVRYIAIDYTVENLISNDRYELSVSDLSVITADGMVLSSARVRLPDDTEIVELERQNILGGERVEGTLFYAVPEDAELNGAYFTASGYLVQLADLSDGTITRPAIGDAVTIVNQEGVEVAAITLIGYDDDFTEVSERHRIERGTRIVAVTVQVENLIANDRYEIRPSNFSLQTEQGMLVSRSSVNLPKDTEIVTLTNTDILGGESTEATIFFVVPEDVEVTGVYFQPRRDLTFLIGDPAA